MVKEPSPTNLLHRLGIRKATKKASAAMPAPKKLAMTISLTNPRIRLRRVPGSNRGGCFGDFMVSDIQSGQSFLRDLDTRYPKMLKKSNAQLRENERRLNFGNPFISDQTGKTKRKKEASKPPHQNHSKVSVKKVRAAVEKKDVEGAQKALLKAIPLIQKARSKGVFHKNTSARKISRLTREVNALETLKSPRGEIASLSFSRILPKRVDVGECSAGRGQSPTSPSKDLSVPGSS